jgi:CRP-like cAMP-binding protein
VPSCQNIAPYTIKDLTMSMSLTMSVFADDQQEAADQILLAAKRITYRPGDQILRRGCTARNLYHLVHGSAACVTASGQVDCFPNKILMTSILAYARCRQLFNVLFGKHSHRVIPKIFIAMICFAHVVQVVLRLGAGEIFGEISFLDAGDTGASTSVNAESEVRGSQSHQRSSLCVVNDVKHEIMDAHTRPACCPLVECAVPGSRISRSPFEVHGQEFVVRNRLGCLHRMKIPTHTHMFVHRSSVLFSRTRPSRCSPASSRLLPSGLS